MLLADRVAIITGGAMGMGRSTAFSFADEGCAVVIADINKEIGTKTANDVSKKGRKCIFMHCDITDIRQIQRVVNQTIGTFGKIDILVNNAGGTLSGPKKNEGSIFNITEEQWDKVLALNLKGYVFFCKAAVPYMKERKYGKIISISSMGVFSPPGPSVAYHSAKAGVLGLTLNIARELAQYNINVNAILPGPIRTAFWGADMNNEAVLSAVAKNNVPLQRIGSPEDIAAAVTFLASDRASYITGAFIDIAGGIPLAPYQG
jgi:3-oxoacyl-[acyl-carrier protein] reductase